MQNLAMHTLHMTKSHSLRCLQAALLFCTLCCFAFLAAFGLTGIAPVSAWADTAKYTVSQVNIQVQVETDGSAHIVEQRTFNFTEDCNAIVWQLDSLGKGQVRTFNSVRVARQVDGSIDGDWENLASNAFVSSWRDGEVPVQHLYSEDRAQSKLYTFFEAAPGTMVAEIDYNVSNFAAAYEDIAEITWRYVGTDWPTSSENVTMTLILPVPLDANVVPGETIHAWGHGSPSGSLSINEDGSVVYKAAQVASGDYADAHVLFPDGWLTNLSLRSIRLYSGVWMYDTALQKEAEWVDTGGQNVILGQKFDIVCMCLGAACVALALLAYVLFGKRLKPQTDEASQREAAQLLADTPAPVLMRLVRWNHWSREDAALDEEQSAPASDEGQPQPSADEDMLQWQKRLDDEVASAGVFDKRSYRVRTILLCAAAVVVVVAFVLWRVTSGRTTPVVVGLITALALIVLANYMPRRTQKGENILQAFEALSEERSA